MSPRPRRPSSANVTPSVHVNYAETVLPMRDNLPLKTSQPSLVALLMDDPRRSPRRFAVAHP
jgi:hypothetical protein